MDALFAALKSEKKTLTQVKGRLTGRKRARRFVRVRDLEKMQSTPTDSQFYDPKVGQMRGEPSSPLKRPRVGPEQAHPVHPPARPIRNLGRDSVVEIPFVEVVRLLRSMDQPITLFGETSLDRLHRLRSLQTNQLSAAGDLSKRMRQAMADPGAAGVATLTETDLLAKAEESQRRLFKTEEEERLDALRLAEIERIHSSTELPNPQTQIELPTPDSDEATLRLRTDSEYTLCILERLLRDWEVYLIKLPNKGSLEYRRDKSIHLQCKDHIRPLLRRLRSNTLARDISKPLHEIVVHIFHREYVKANSVFMRLAIGNAPWPMGVTNVGIHARASNDRIQEGMIAHVLNDEVQRKYIQSVKRLISFSQRKYPCKARHW